MRLATSSGVLACAIALPAAALAANQHLSRKEKANTETEMAFFSKCVVKESRARLPAYLRLSPNAKIYHQTGQSLASGGCLSMSSASMKFNSDLFRWSLFEALHKADFGDQPVEDLSSVPPLDFRGERDWVSADENDYANQYVAVREFGDCSVRKNTALVASLLTTKVYSGAEQALFAQLGPNLGKCLAGSGKLRFTRTSLRGILAEALYNLRMKLRSSAPAAPISGAKL